MGMPARAVVSAGSLQEGGMVAWGSVLLGHHQVTASAAGIRAVSSSAAPVVRKEASHIPSDLSVAWAVWVAWSRSPHAAALAPRWTGVLRGGVVPAGYPEGRRLRESSVSHVSPRVVDATVVDAGTDGHTAWRESVLPADTRFRVDGTTVTWLGEPSLVDGEPYWSGTNAME
ncbi:hypothetical protein AB0N88_05040 [Streptomyces sp. NPDC093516]|uniref:hypothetical protein n=1 Tax=Streptomyces sp. NPDC093516 TaxID=3155304 RepID=UPI003447CEE1